MINYLYKIFITTIIGSIFIFLEFYLYTIFSIFESMQLIIIIPILYLVYISLKKGSEDILILNQISAVLIGFSYGMLSTMSPELYALMFYAVVTLLTKYLKYQKTIYLYFYFNIMYFVCFSTRIMYFVLRKNIDMENHELVINNLALPTVINALILTGIVMLIKQNTKRSKGYKYKRTKYSR